MYEGDDRERVNLRNLSNYFGIFVISFIIWDFM